MLLPGHDTAMMICMMDKWDPMLQRPLYDALQGMVQSLTWAAGGRAIHTHWQIVSNWRKGRGALIDLDVSSQKREVFVPLANLSLDCKRLGGCVNSMVDWGRAHVWSVERPPLVPKGEKKLEARLRCGKKGFRNAGSEFWTWSPGSPKW